MRFAQYIRENENKEKAIELSIHNDEVKKAFFDFVRLTDDEECVVAGGLAFGVWIRPRNTEDIDLFLLSDEDINKLVEKLRPKFNKVMPHILRHKSTGVEIDLCTPEHLNINKDIVKRALENCITQSILNHKVKILTPKYLIILKLKRSLGTNHKSYMDRSDIVALTEAYGEFDMTKEGLSIDEIKQYQSLVSDALKSKKEITNAF